jgi:hypothetical protein
MYGGKKKCIQDFGGKTGMKETTWKTWEDNIKIDLQEMGWGHGLDGAGSGQGQVAGACECGNELPGSINVGNFLTS